MFKADKMFLIAPVNSLEPSLEPQPNPEPDAAVGTNSIQVDPVDQNAEIYQTDQAPSISPADWDALFYAITARLRACAGSDSLDHLPEHMLGVTASLQATARECAASLNKLHAALVRERHQHQPSE